MEHYSTIGGHAIASLPISGFVSGSESGESGETRTSFFGDVGSRAIRTDSGSKGCCGGAKGIIVNKAG